MPPCGMELEQIVINYQLLLLLFFTVPLARLLHKITTPVSSWVSATGRRPPPHPPHTHTLSGNIHSVYSKCFSLQTVQVLTQCPEEVESLKVDVSELRKKIQGVSMTVCHCAQTRISCMHRRDTRTVQSLLLAVGRVPQICPPQESPECQGEDTEWCR